MKNRDEEVKNMFRDIQVTFITELSFGKPEGIGVFLNVLESEPSFKPTHWGPDERAQLPYSRDLLLLKLSESRSGLLMPGLRRGKKWAYEAYFTTNAHSLNILSLQFPSPSVEEVKQVFELGNLLAEQLKPELGFVHPIFSGVEGHEAQQYNASGTIGLKDYRKFGPEAVNARTWFGPHLVKLIGSEVFDLQIPGLRTDWGGVQLDLVKEPWQSNLYEMYLQQEQVMKKLARTCVFGDYSDSVRPKAASRWVPIPTNLKSVAQL